VTDFCCSVRTLTGKSGLSPTFQAIGNIKRTKDDILQKISNTKPYKYKSEFVNQKYNVPLNIEINKRSKYQAKCKFAFG
jgi:hypothetical protein